MTAALWTRRHLPFVQRALNCLPAFYLILAHVGAVSSALAIAQYFGWFPWPVREGTLPGLFYSPITQGTFLALLSIGLVIYSHSIMLIYTIPGLVLAQNRGGWAILGIGLVAYFTRRPLVILLLALAIAFIVTNHPSPSDLQRLEIWRVAFANLTLFGHGLGSFWTVFVLSPSHEPFWAQYAHNDYLQLAFELGILAIPLYALAAWGAFQSQAQSWPVLIAFLFAATFSMPIHLPLAALIGAVAFLSTILENKNA